MKIGVIISDLVSQNGGGRIALSGARELARQGHEVTVYTQRYIPERTYQDLITGYGVRSLPTHVSRKARPVLGIPVRGFSTLSSYVNEHRMARLLAGLIDRDVDALNPHGSRIAYLAAHHFQKRVRRVPTVYQMNDPQLIEWRKCRPSTFNTEPHCSPAKRTLFRLIDWYDTARFLKSVGRIAVLNSETKNYARGALGREAAVVRAGVDTDFFAFRSRPPPSGQRVTFLSYANFFPHRRFEDGIDAVRILVDRGYDPAYIILGDSHTYRIYRDYRDRLAAQAAAAGVADRVSFPGRPTQAEALRHLHEADVFVHPNYLQTWGLVVFEAMATGIPTILSRGAGAHEVLTDRQQAMLVNPKDPSAIAGAVGELIADSALYHRLSTEGSAFARREISWGRYADGIVALIAEAAGDSQAAGDGAQ